MLITRRGYHNAIFIGTGRDWDYDGGGDVCTVHSSVRKLHGSVLPGVVHKAIYITSCVSLHIRR